MSLSGLFGIDDEVLLLLLFIALVGGSFFGQGHGSFGGLGSLLRGGFGGKSSPGSFGGGSGGLFRGGLGGLLGGEDDIIFYIILLLVFTGGFGLFGRGHLFS